MAFDPQVTAAIATGIGSVAAAFLLRTGKRKNKQQPESNGGVSLTKQLMDQQRADFRERIRELEAENEELRTSRDTARAERDTLQHELNYAQNRNRDLGGP